MLAATPNEPSSGLRILSYLAELARKLLKAAKSTRFPLQKLRAPKDMGGVERFKSAAKNFRSVSPCAAMCFPPVAGDDRSHIIRPNP
jgi:hypothetical protein